MKLSNVIPIKALHPLEKKILQEIVKYHYQIPLSTDFLVLGKNIYERLAISPNTTLFLVADKVRRFTNDSVFVLWKEFIPAWKNVINVIASNPEYLFKIEYKKGG